MIEIVSEDGKRRVEIAGEGGLFAFTEYSELWDEGYGNVSGSYYWAPTHVSGFYDSAEAAEADARAILSWLQETSSS